MPTPNSSHTTVFHALIVHASVPVKNRTAPVELHALPVGGGQAESCETGAVLDVTCRFLPRRHREYNHAVTPRQAFFFRRRFVFRDATDFEPYFAVHLRAIFWCFAQR
jgi:hypothetical protein